MTDRRLSNGAIYCAKSRSPDPQSPVPDPQSLQIVTRIQRRLRARSAAVANAASTMTGKIASRYSREARMMLLRGWAASCASLAASANISGETSLPARKASAAAARNGIGATGPKAMVARDTRLPDKANVTAQFKIGRTSDGRRPG